MSDEAKSSEGGLAIAPPIARPEAPRMDEQPIRESEFLEWQADQAKAAFDQTFAEFKQSLRDSAKLRVWAQRHPWAVTGAAAAGGFLLAKMVFASLAAEPAPADTSAATSATNGQPHAPAPEPKRHRFAWLLTPLWELAQPMLGQMIGSLLGAIAGAAGASAAGMAAQANEGEASDGDAGRTSASEGPVPL